MSVSEAVAGSPGRLSTEQVHLYRERGYLAPLPVFHPDEALRLREAFDWLQRLLPPGLNINFVNWWHKRCRFLYEICMESRILDLVEGLLGPDFYLWGSQFFVKAPGDGSVVPWHQDAQYWPLAPLRVVTVFIAFTACDRGNACMRVIPASHRGRRLSHRRSDDPHYVLPQEILPGQVDESAAAYLELASGEVSLHDDRLVHGSGPNNSDRLRVGFTMRFSSTDVKCDLSVWPNFQAFQARGEDRLHLNSQGTPPVGNEAPTGMMQ